MQKPTGALTTASVVARNLARQGAIEKHFAWRFLPLETPRTGTCRLLWRHFRFFAHPYHDPSLSVPLGIAAAVYLEEFVTKNNDGSHRSQYQPIWPPFPPYLRLLGLAVFINFLRPAAFVSSWWRSCAGASGFCLPSSSPRGCLEGGPPSIKEAALGVGLRTSRRCSTMCCPGGARHSHWHNSRRGPRPWRDRATADDRHGGLHRGCSQGFY